MAKAFEDLVELCGPNVQPNPQPDKVENFAKNVQF
jgi:hypothetical protein